MPTRLVIVGGPAYLPSCLMRQRNAQIVTAVPTIRDNHNARGVCIKASESSSIHKPRKTNTPAMTRASSEISTNFLFMTVPSFYNKARATANANCSGGRGQVIKANPLVRSQAERLVVLADSEDMCRLLAAVWGVSPLFAEAGAGPQVCLTLAGHWLFARQLAHPGDPAVVLSTSGSCQGKADTLQVVRLQEEKPPG